MSLVGRSVRATSSPAAEGSTWIQGRRLGRPSRCPCPLKVNPYSCLLLTKPTGRTGHRPRAIEETFTRFAVGLGFSQVKGLYSDRKCPSRQQPRHMTEATGSINNRGNKRSVNRDCEKNWIHNAVKGQSWPGERERGVCRLPPQVRARPSGSSWDIRGQPGARLDQRPARRLAPGTPPQWPPSSAPAAPGWTCPG